MIRDPRLIRDRWASGRWRIYKLDDYLWRLMSPEGEQAAWSNTHAGAIRQLDLAIHRRAFVASLPLSRVGS